MAYEILEIAPKSDDFKPLAEHQEQTPGSFFAGKPVLHLYCPNAKITLSAEDLTSQPDFATLLASGGAASALDTGEAVGPDVDVWVTSRHLTFFNNLRPLGLQIPYPTITIHAQEGSAVLLELNLSDPDTADEDLEFLQLRITPDKTEGVAEPAEHSEQTNGQSASASAVQQLYEAISACQELNPDPPSDEEGGFDETAAGATGWITSENMADFMDENGNFRMPEGAAMIGGEDKDEGADVDGEDEADRLGAGAGRTRTAAEVDAEDGVEDETKWQRTG